MSHDATADAPHHDRELRRLARGGLGGLAGAVITSLGGLAFIMVATWAFPKAEVGIVFTQTSLFLIALAVVTLGSDIGVVRFVAIKLEEERGATRSGRSCCAALVPARARPPAR